MSEITVRNGIEYTQAKLVDSATGRTITKEMPISVLKSFTQNADGSYVVPSAGKGLQVEGKETVDKSVIAEKTSQNVDLASLYKACNVADENQVEFIKFLSEKGINITTNGEVPVDDKSKAKLEQAIGEYNTKNAKPSLHFTEESDPAVLEYCLDNGIIGKDKDGKYVVLDQEKLNKFTKTEKTETEDVTNPVSLDGTTTTQKKHRNKAVDIPDDITTSRKSRKQVKADYEEVIKKQLAEGKHENQKKSIIASSRYDKKIAKEEAKIMKETKGRPVEILKKFMNEGFASEVELSSIQKTLNAAEKDDALLVAAWNNDAKTSGRKPVKSADELNDAQRNTAKYLALEGMDGFNSKALVERMALETVMDGRSEKKIEKDDKWFVENQADRITKAAVTEKKIENTEVHYSKADRKSDSNDPNKTHTDIGKTGRKLVEKAPSTFCDEVSKKDWDENLGPKVTDSQGKVHYFKFNQKKYDKYCDAVVNSSNPEQYAKDNNLTLKEARAEIMRLGTLYDVDGNELNIEEAIGNGNGKVGNGELNDFRHFVEAGGRSIDKNPTNAKRMLNVIKDFGIGYGLGFLTGGLGSVIAGNVAESGMTAAQSLIAPGQTVDIPGYHIEDTVNFKFNGETFTKKIVHDIPADQITTDEQQLIAEGQNYNTSGNNHLKTANNAGLMAGTGAAIYSAINMGKTHAKGHNNDWIINTDIYSDSVDLKKSKLDLNVKQQNKVLTLKGNVAYGLEARDLGLQKKHKLTDEQLESNSAKNKAQHVHVNVGAGEGGIDNYKQPSVIKGPDVSNAKSGKINNYTYSRLDDAQVAEFKAKGMIPQNAEGPFYILDKATNKQGKNIKQQHVEIYQFKGYEAEATNVDGNTYLGFKYILEQFEGLAGNNKRSVNNKAVQNWW